MQHRLRKCDHKEADDWMMFHANHAIKVENYKNLVIFNSINRYRCFGVCTASLWSLDLLERACKVCYPSIHHVWRVRYRGTRHFTSNGCSNWLWHHKQGWNKNFSTPSSNWRGSENVFRLWKRWIVGEHDCNGRIFLDKVCITCNRVPNIWWIEASCVSHQEFPIRHRETALYIQCFSFAYSQRVLTMLSLVTRTVCWFDHIRPKPVWVLSWWRRKAEPTSSG